MRRNMAENFHADLAILGGNIITVAPAKPRAQALVVKFGKILAVGRDDELKPLIDKNTKVINADGKTVIPGIIDAHCHGMAAARQSLQVDRKSVV
jgi:predicted amidohydrolase YtcJ